MKWRQRVFHLEVGLWCLEKGPEKSRGEKGRQSSVEEKCLLWSFRFQKRGLGCNAKVCITEQILVVETADMFLCASASLGDSSGPTTGRDSKVAARQSPGAWATPQEGFEGTVW